jgi:hypothetical protein
VSFPKFIVIDGKRIAWRDLLKLRREQREAAQIAQPVLFELKDDTRPKSQQTAASRNTALRPCIARHGNAFCHGLLVKILLKAMRRVSGIEVSHAP